MKTHLRGKMHNIDDYVKEFYSKLEAILEGARGKERSAERIMLECDEKRAKLNAEIEQTELVRAKIAEENRERVVHLEELKETLEREESRRVKLLGEAEYKWKVADDNLKNANKMAEDAKNELFKHKALTEKLEKKSTELEKAIYDTTEKGKQIDRMINEAKNRENWFADREDKINRRMKALNDRESELDARTEELKRIQRTINGR